MCTILFPAAYRRFAAAATAGRSRGSHHVFSTLVQQQGGIAKSTGLEPGSRLLAAASHGCFQRAVGLAGDFRGGPLAVDALRQRLFVACGDHVLVQDLTNRTKPPARIDVGRPRSFQVRFEDRQLHISETPLGAASLSYSEKLEKLPGVYLHLPGHGTPPEWYAPDRIAALESRIRQLPHGRGVILAGRVFGESLRRDSMRVGMSVASNDGDNDGYFGWPGTVTEVLSDDRLLVQRTPWAPIGSSAPATLGASIAKSCTAKLHPCLQRVLGAVLAAEHVGSTRHGDALAVIGRKGLQGESKHIHIAAEYANLGFQEVRDKGIETSALHFREAITGLAFDAPRRKLVAATNLRLMEHCQDTKATRCVAAEPQWPGGSHGIALDQERGLLYFTTPSDVLAMNINDGASRPLASSSCKPEGLRSVAHHNEWLLVAHSDGVTIVDQDRDIALLIAECKNTSAAMVVHDRIALVMEHAVHLAPWSLSEIAARVAHIVTGGCAESPPPTERWLGLDKPGFPVVGLRPASTALNGIAGVACHEGEVFLSHDAGVFSLPLSPPPAHVSPENQAQVAFDRGFPSDFAVAVPTYGVIIWALFN